MKKYNEKNNILWGLVFLAIAGLFILDSLNIFPTFSMLLIIETLILVYFLIKNTLKKRIFTSITLLGILFILYNKKFALVDISNWSLAFIVILIAIGLSLIFKQSKILIITPFSLKYWKQKKYKYEDYINMENKEKDYSNKYYHKTFFGESIKHINIDEVEDITLASTLAEQRIFFNSIESKQVTKTINIDLSLGEITLFFPKEWYVNTDNIKIKLGELIEQKASYENKDISIYIRGGVKLGELKIKYI